MKLSQQTRELIQIIVFLVVVATLVIVFVVYPLGRAKTTMARAGIDDYSEDSVLVNDPTLWIDSGLAVDTFSVESDGLTTLACLYLTPDSTHADSAVGTVCLIHAEGDDRDAMLPLARAFRDSGYVVVVYDQRASGRSTGTYHGEGYYEGDDLQSLVSYLELREKVVHPLTIIGFSLGGDAAILAALEEKRIDNVVAIDPYLTTKRMQDALAALHDSYWFPFHRTVTWWWYNMRSSYAAPYRGIGQLQPVGCRTLLVVPPAGAGDPEVQTLSELSEPTLLTVKPALLDPDALLTELFAFIAR